MKPAAAGLALLLAACAAGRPRVADPDDRFSEIFEVRLPVHPYTPLASVLPELHKLAGQVCPGLYDIIDRRMQPLLRSAPSYDRARRTVQPAPYPTAEIIATVRCHY